MQAECRRFDSDRLHHPYPTENKTMELTQEQVIDHLGSMTVMEMVTLVHELEEKWGVSATPQVIPKEIGEAFCFPRRSRPSST